MVKSVLIALIFFLFSATHCLSQATTPQATTPIVLNKNYNGVPFQQFVEQIESEYSVRFFFNKEWVASTVVKQPLDETSLHYVLKETLSEIRMDYVLLFNKFIVLVSAENNEKTLQSNLAQKMFFLNGYVKNSQNGAGIPAATVFVPSINKGSVTDQNGFFSLSVQEGNYNVTFSALGYSQTLRAIRVYSNISTEVELFEEVRELDEVIISGALTQQLNSLSLGQQQVSTESLKAIPPLMGEIDVVRSVLSLPGVTSVGEGASGFNVRGGNVDQNLILIDNAPLFNSSHLFGLFSVVNSDIVSGLTIHKGTMSARYGGRLSSVLDITFEDRLDLQSLEMQGSIGMISSKLKLATPIVKNKTSFVFAARGAYPDWILKIVPDKDVRNSSANFYDGTIKISHRVNDKNFISATGHVSNDAFRLGADTTYSWFGGASSFQWLHHFSQKMSSRFSLYYSGNKNDVVAQGFLNGFNLSSSIQTTGLNFDVEFEPFSNHQFEFGVQGNLITADRGDFKPSGGESILQPVNLPTENGVESSVYFSDAIAVTPLLSILAGIRLSGFLAFGSGIKRLYEPGQPRNESTLIGEQVITSDEIEKSFLNVEPRLAAKIALTAESSFKIGFSRNFQYVSLLSNTVAISPMDVWKLSDSYLEPQKSDQFSAGYFKNFLNGGFETSIEGYYKIFSSITQYKEGARLILNEQIETDLLQGVGKSYGFEVYVKKNIGMFTGWLSYTFSRSLVKVKSSFDEETLSKGEYFPSNFDKPHDLSLVLNYAVSKRVSFSGNFAYNTGRPITYPESIYVLDGYLIANYSEINQARIPDYHRLDLSMNHRMLQKRNRKFETSWSMGFYNVYARRNPFSVFFKPEYSGRYPQAYRLSILGTVIPYFSFNFKIK